MPLPMVHLKVAVSYREWLNIKEDLNPFYLGNIAPDAIHMRKGSTRDDKNRTHFSPNAEGDYLKRLEDNYMSYIHLNLDSDWKWFVKGYFMHLLTDYYWFRDLYSKFAKSGLQKHTQEHLRTLYYKETDQVDFNIYKQEVWRKEVWDSLNHARSFNFGDLLTSEEIMQWRDRTFVFFNDDSKEPGIVPEYITNKLVDDFVQETVPRLEVIISGWECGPINHVSNLI